MTRVDLGARFELLFARRLRYLRVSRFLTQKEVASAIACNVLTYAGYDLLCRDEILIEMEHEL